MPKHSIRARPLGTREAEGSFEFRGEFAQGMGDLVRLFGERTRHALKHVGLVPEEFRRRHDQRQVVVDIMPHVGEMTAQLFNLLDA